MTEKKPVDKGPARDSTAQQAAKEVKRAKALKANLRRRKAAQGSEPEPS